MKRARLVVHPIRLRILQALTAEKDTTQGLADRLPDVPRSSIYRHLRLLLEGDLVRVASTQRVRGVDQRLYEISGSAHLSADDVAGISSDEHLEMFSTYVLTLLADFGDFLRRTPAPDFAADRVGYTETVVHVTDPEFDALAGRLNAAIAPVRNNKPGPKRRPRKLSVITFPVGPTPGTDD